MLLDIEQEGGEALPETFNVPGQDNSLWGRRGELRRRNYLRIHGRKTWEFKDWVGIRG